MSIRFMLRLMIIGVCCFSCENETQELKNTTPSGLNTNSPYIEWANEVLGQIESDLGIPGQPFSFYENQDKNSISFIWGNIFLLYTRSEAALIGISNAESSLMSTVSLLDKHWHSTFNGIAGYATSQVTSSGTPDRFYDENGWVAIGLVDASKAIDANNYLIKAEKATEFTFSGLSPNGGIFFKESGQYSDYEATISCAVGMLSALKLYQLTNNDKYLTDAELVNNWVMANVLDSNDNLIFDGVFADGSVQEFKWSYNSGFMVQVWLKFYEITREDRYLIQAKKTLESAENQWYNRSTSSITGPGYFGFTLIDCWYAMYEVEQDLSWLQKAFKTVDYIHANLRDANGRYPEYWENIPNLPLEEWDLRYLSVVAYIYMKAGRYKSSL